MFDLPLQSNLLSGRRFALLRNRLSRNTPSRNTLQKNCVWLGRNPTSVSDLPQEGLTSSHSHPLAGVKSLLPSRFPVNSGCSSGVQDLDPLKVRLEDRKSKEEQVIWFNLPFIGFFPRIISSCSEIQDQTSRKRIIDGMSDNVLNMVKFC